MTWVIRVVRTCGTVPLARDLVLVAVPAPGARVDLTAQGGPLAKVEEVRFTPRGTWPGLVDPGVTLLLAPEPADALEAATAAGWHPLTAPALH